MIQRQGLKSEGLKSGGLPARWRRNRLLAGVAVLAAAVLITGLLRPVDHADRLDAWWLSARYSLRERLRKHSTPDPDIAILGIDEKTYAAWPEPTLFWGPRFARVVQRLCRSGAKLIVFDYIPQADPEPYKPGINTSFQQALMNAPAVIWAKKYVLMPDGTRTPIHPHESLLFATPGAGEHGADSIMGYAEFPQWNSVVTSLQPAWYHDNVSVSLAARVVEAYQHGNSELRAHGWYVSGLPERPLRRDATLLPDLPDSLGETNSQGSPSQVPFLKLSMADMAVEPDLPDLRLKDKIVFIGETASDGADNHYIPFLVSLNGNRRANGVEIQAAMARALLRGQILKEPGEAAAWGLSIVLCIFALLAFLMLRWLPAVALSLGLAAGWILLSLILFCTASIAMPTLTPLLGLAVTGGGMAVFINLSEERERRQVLKLWGRYQDPRLVDYLLLNPGARGGQGEEKIVTVLFADLKSFTQTVEKLSPPEALRVLNSYLRLIESVVLKHGGLIDKYLGDGLMAQWGAPGGLSREDHAQAAVSACLEIQEKAQRYVAEHPEALHFGLRLTLHTGPAVFGWVGGTRLEFTIIGDTVNVTSRLQETAKELNATFLISEATYEAVSNSVSIGQQAEVAIRGRVEPLRVLEVTGPKRREMEEIKCVQRRKE